MKGEEELGGGFKSPREQNYFFFSVFKLKRALHVVFLETEGKIAF